MRYPTDIRGSYEFIRVDDKFALICWSAETDSSPDEVSPITISCIRSLQRLEELRRCRRMTQANHILYGSLRVESVRLRI